MAAEASDNLPLKTTPPSSPTDAEPKVKTPFVGLFLNKTKLIGIAVVVLVLILLVIILAALLGHANSKLKKSQAGVDDRKDGGKTTGSSPTEPVPTTPGTEAWWDVRLPKNIIPVHYDVLLDIDLEKHRFDGNVAIIANVTSSTNLVLVHSNKMNVTSAKVSTYAEGSAEKELSIVKHFWFKKNQFYVIQLEDNLEPGQIVIKMTFEAFLTDGLAGLYRSSYKHADGTNVTIATTQFQPTDARMAFPCFDEPALKATFSVVLVHRSDFIALSCMPIYKSEIKDNKTYDYFEKTVVMPTYLLAFVVCDFAYKEIITENNVTMRFYAPKDKIDQVDYAKSVGGKMMTHFEKFYGIRYPLPKADMIAIPDFAAGAMENWGLITYRETALLWKNGSSSESNKQRVATVISHELVHQWFGNLVTMKWWDDLWLNEGFASFVEYDGVKEVEPTWAMDDQFVIADMASAFNLDGLASSHPIKVDVNHPDEINEIFDSISYNKGASILRMLQSILGKDVFQKGLTRYLKKHAYGNAETDDLWQALKQESCARKPKCIDVKKIMDTWTLQMGYPVLNMEKKNNTHYHVTQSHFLYNPAANVSASKYKSPFNYTWEVPFTYKISSKAGPNEILMEKGSVDIEYDGNEWIKGNFGQYGFYRVNYPPDIWIKLTDQLKNNHKAWSISDRAGLIADAFSLARATMVNYSVALETTSYLRNETDWVPMEAADKGFSYILSLLSNTRPAYKHLTKYLKYQTEPLYQTLGFKDEGSHLDKYMRSDVLQYQCRAEVQSCLNKANEYFQNWMKDPDANPVPADFRSLVYYYGVANGGEEEWDFAFEQFQKSNVASEKIRLMYGMAASKESWILERYLKYSLDPTKIRAQDAIRVASYVANYNDIGGQLAWNFLQLNWDTYRERYGSGFFAFGNLIRSVTRGFNSEYQLKELIAFNEKNKDAGSGARAQKQAVDRVKANIKWLKSNEQEVEKWLEKFLEDKKIP